MCVCVCVCVCVCCVCASVMGSMMHSFTDEELPTADITIPISGEELLYQIQYNTVLWEGFTVKAIHEVTPSYLSPLNICTLHTPVQTGLM